MHVTRGLWLFLFVGLTMGVCFFYTLTTGRSHIYTLTPGQPIIDTEPIDLSRFRTDFFEKQERIQADRIHQIRKICSASSVKGKTGRSNHYLFSPTYNFSLCHVPKSGSTFWKQAILSLENGSNATPNSFAVDRFKVHRSIPFRALSGNNMGKQAADAPFVLVSRNPFSRIFSAYIDKVFLTELSGSVKTPNKKSRCNYITFQEFLDFVTKDPKGINNVHWKPVHHFCRACDRHVAILLKQESFASDAEFILEYFNVKSKNKEDILDALHGRRIEYTIPSLVSTIFFHASRTKAFQCYGEKSFVERIWRSFQIQGYLRDTVPFPNDADKDSLRNESYVTDLVLDAIAENQMSETDQIVQRKAALVNAYRDVKKETIRKLKQIYKTDFDMFGYDSEPP